MVTRWILVGKECACYGGPFVPSCQAVCPCYLLFRAVEQQQPYSIISLSCSVKFGVFFIFKRKSALFFRNFNISFCEFNNPVIGIGRIQLVGEMCHLVSS